MINTVKRTCSFSTVVGIHEYAGQRQTFSGNPKYPDQCLDVLTISLSLDMERPVLESETDSRRFCMMEGFRRFIWAGQTSFRL